MPVFETGAFNHSATCPTEPGKLVRAKTVVNARRLRFSRRPRQSEAGAGTARTCYGSPANSTLEATVLP